MLKVSEKIVKFRKLILVLAFLLLIPSGMGYLNTKVNYDILYYLPDEIETMKGQDVLLDDFGKGAYGMFVCNGMNKNEVQNMKEEVEQIDHVAQVICFDSLTGGRIPKEMLPESVKDIFYGRDGNSTLMFLFFDTTTSQDETMDAIEELRLIAGKNCFLSSMSAISTDTKNLVESEMLVYTAIAVALCILVLLVTTDSFLIPILFMISIGLAVIYNLGSNVIQGEISYITMALVAILQLGVTMDYSIFLYHSYKEQQEEYEDSKEAMAHAIAATIVSVTGSSLTTIAGFLAMCFMTFSLGLDMGVVMAKGVVLGVICCVTVLPSLILIFDKWVKKTEHKAIHIKGEKLTKLITKIYPVIAILMVVLSIPAIHGNNNVKVYYKLDESLPEELPSRQANAVLADNFELSSISMVLVDADMSTVDTVAMMDDIQNIDGVSFALGADSLKAPLIPEEMLPGELEAELTSDNWKLMVINSEYATASDEVNEQITKLNDILKKYDKNGMLIGEAPCTKDMIDITDHDFKVVDEISIVAIFIIILLVLKSFSLPIILVSVIELAIFINLGFCHLLGTSMPFIAPICISTIQLGSTVDYAILMTTRYKRERSLGGDKKTSVSIALKTSIPSVVVSALGFFAATFGVGLYSDVDIISSICNLMARGAVISMLAVIFILPAMFMLFDKVICNTSIGFKPKKQTEAK